MFDVIIAMTPNNGIGLNGNMPWHCPEELKLFKQKTNGCNLVVGKNTAMTLPVLKNRKVIVLSQYKTIPNTICQIDNVYNSLSDILSFYDNTNLIIAGGARLYNEVFTNWKESINKVHLSIMKSDYKCDTFVKFNPMEWVVETKEEYNNFTHYVLLSKSSEEKNYLCLLENVYKNGWEKNGRNGITKSIFGYTLTFDLTNGFPLLTTKKMFFRGVVEELLFFIRGDTDSQILENKNINIWTGNTNREFLDSIGKNKRRKGVMGPCFIKGTQTLTMEGYKPIELVKKNDLLFTHTGKWKPVIECFKRIYVDSFIELKVSCHPILTVTPEHPFFVKKIFTINKSHEKHKDQINHEYQFESPEWVEAKNINNNCVIGMKIEETECIPIIDNIKIETENEWFMLGFFLGSGCIHSKLGVYNTISFIINNKDDNTVLPQLTKILNLQQLYSEYVCHDTKYLNILKTFGTSFYKKIIPDWVHKAPCKMICWFLDGYFKSSGCVSNRISGSKDNLSIFRRYITVSVDIAYSLQRLYMKLGFFAEINLYKRSYYKKEFDKQPYDLYDTYCIEVYKNCISYKNFSHISNGYAWFKVLTVDEVKFNETTNVYNFDVEDDHTYTVENCSVHNCYGYQWRHFNADYDEEKAIPINTGIDQLKNVVDMIKNDPNSRRIMMTDFNPSQVEQCVLPPCHSIILQFYVQNGFLDMFSFNRSSDLFHGLPFNIASSSLLLTLIAKLAGLIPRKFILSLGDCHIYQSHYTVVNEQLKRIPYKFPELVITKKLNDLKDIEQMEFVDFHINNYKFYPVLKADMVS